MCVQYRCDGSVLFLNHNPTSAAWLSRDGTPQIYWGGATSRRERYCACGETSKSIKICQVRSQGCFYCIYCMLYFVSVALFASILMLLHYADEAVLLTQEKSD